MTALTKGVVEIMMADGGTELQLGKFVWAFSLSVFRVERKGVPEGGMSMLCGGRAKF